MSQIFGLDLGTTNSCLALLSEGRPRVIPVEGTGLVPSVVSWDGEKMLVGRKAWNRAAAFPEDTVKSVKRLMGTDQLLTLGGKDYRPEEISALILGYLRDEARRLEGLAVERVVITVPAYFSDAQRRATLEAGRLAGLTVERLINEPTAAALFYDQVRPSSETKAAPWKHALVYDLGGGTFDISILRMDEIVEVLASTGDTRLGGDDFDARLAALALSRIQEEGGPDLSAHRPALARLTAAAEAAKIRLSQKGEAKIEETALPVPGGGPPVSVSLTVTREEFESLTRDLLERTLDFVDQALDQAGLRAEDIDRVLPVGGMTRLPAVAEHLVEAFGRASRPAVDPDLSVAFGAAVEGGVISGEKPELVLVDVTAHTLSLAAMSPESGELECAPIIPRNTPMPAVRSRLFRTIYENQSRVQLRVYQGEEIDPDLNTLINASELKLAKAEMGCPVEVEYSYDLNGIVHMTAEQKGYSRRTEVRFDSRRPLTDQDQELDWESEDLEDGEPEEAAPVGRNFVSRRAHSLMDSAAGPERERLAGLLARYEAALAEDAEELDDLEDELLTLMDEMK